MKAKINKILKRFFPLALKSISILLVLVRASSLQAQVPEEISPVEEMFNFLFARDDALSFYLRLYQEYDDNIRLEPSGPRESSWKSTISPTIKIDIDNSQTIFKAAYTPSFIFYYPVDKQFDLNQHGNLNLLQKLTPRDTIGLEEIFISKQDPEDIRPISEPTQRNADYIRNHLTLAYRHDLNQKYAFIVKYRNERDDYSKSSGLQGLDYWSNNGELFIRSQISPLFYMESFYRYRNTNYDTYGSDYQSHLGGLELSYQFSNDCEAKLEGGFEARRYTGDRRLNSPYLKLSFHTALYHNLELSLKYWYKIEDTFELNYLGYQGQGINAILLYHVSPRVFISLSTLAEFAYFPSILNQGGSSKSAQEYYLRGIISLSYEVQSDIFIGLGYDKTHNDSDFENASYRRNLLFVRLIMGL